MKVKRDVQTVRVQINATFLWARHTAVLLIIYLRSHPGQNFLNTIYWVRLLYGHPSAMIVLQKVHAHKGYPCLEFHPINTRVMGICA